MRAQLDVHQQRRLVHSSVLKIGIIELYTFIIAFTIYEEKAANTHLRGSRPHLIILHNKNIK